MKFISNSPSETEKIGYELGRELLPNDFVALFGDLGSGKTVLVTGIARALGIDGHITSPTFSLINEYKGKLPLYHFDVYRLEGGEGLFDIGFDDYIENGGVCAVEWSENIEDFLPPRHYRVTIKGSGDNEREIEIERVGF